jgi:hypothetical protein
MLNKSNARAIGLLAAVFIAGATLAWGFGEWRGDSRPCGRRRDTDAMVEFLDRKVGLRPAQRDSVRAVFVRYRAAMDAIWAEVHPRVDSVRNLMRAEINAQLDSAQRERYARLIAEHGHHHRKADSARDTTGGRE